MAKQYVLAADLGTGGPKVAIVSVDGEVACHDFEPTSLYLKPGGGAEQDPADWWRAITTGFRRVLARRQVPPADIIAVSCTSQWGGTVAVDTHGDHLMNALIWMDARGDRYVGEVTGGLPTIEGYNVGKLAKWIRRSGGAPGQSGKDPIGHILYIKHEHPDVYAATHKFLEPVDYLNLRLTGEVAASWDSIIAHFVTDNRDIDNIHYDPELVEMSGIDRAKLPDLVPSASVVGYLRQNVAAELGLGPDVVVITGSGDMQSAAIGSGAVDDYQGHVYVGTSSWVSCHVPFKKSDVFHNMATLPAALPGKYFVVNGTGTAGECLEFLTNNIFYHDDELGTDAPPPDVYEIYDRIIERAPPGAGKVIFTPWLNGERSPIDDETVRGAFVNLSLTTTREHLIRSVYEGVVLHERWLLTIVERLVGRRLDPLNFIGGGANSKVWSQLHADILGRTVRQVADPILANVRGAAFLAGLALGHVSAAEIPAKVPIVGTYEPNDDDRDVYDELYAEFRHVYKNNKKMYARLNSTR